MYDFDKTIAAIATPPGEGGVGIVRLSGPEALRIASGLFVARDKRPLTDAVGYSAHFGDVVVDGKTVDEAIALVFRAPKSYTAEDVAELQCHGSAAALETVLRAVISAGAVPAARGEFTRRAFLNKRISLAEAEAVMSLISAAGKEGELAAASLIKGSMYRRINEIKNDILAVQSAMSASLDFPEEDLEEPDVPRLIDDLEKISARIKVLLDGYDAGAAVLRGVSAVIAGEPNVGKSTIMNLLAGFDKSIVTSRAGTTRDVIEQRINLDGITLLLADTAGLRESDDEIESIGVDRAKQRIHDAVLVLAVFDSSKPLGESQRELIKSLKDKNTVAIINKIDLSSVLDEGEIEKNFKNICRISATDKNSLQILSQTIKRAVGAANLSSDAPLLVNERQRSCAKRSFDALEAVLSALRDGVTLDVVYDLSEEALEALMELTGENAAEATVEEVFSKFCVGK